MLECGLLKRGGVQPERHTAFKETERGEMIQDKIVLSREERRRGMCAIGEASDGAVCGSDIRHGIEQFL